MKIVWLRKALFDINALEEYIAQDNRSAARRACQQIKKAVELLGRQPEIGRTGRVAGTRELVVPGTPYVVAYTSGPATVLIIAVIHGARKWPDAF